jgi:hypothetical protein
MAEHTTGPWQVWGGSRHVCADNERIAVIADLPIREGENCVSRVHEFEANARLIAAAPELVAALEAIIGSTLFTIRGTPCDPSALLKQARAALAKARGESHDNG